MPLHLNANMATVKPGEKSTLERWNGWEAGTEWQGQEQWQWGSQDTAWQDTAWQDNAMDRSHIHHQGNRQGHVCL